jgi:ubiquinone/menaquinone biosynthesis C-methylase UbiE
MTSARHLPTVEEIWRRYDAIESRLTAPLSERMLDLAGLAPGMRVLDLATGRGEPALRAARRVGPAGHVLGVELQGALMRMAQEQAELLGLKNLELREGNAESPEGIPPSHFHAATVRWALMYMTAPVAALQTARRALLPEGVLVAALWAEPERVPYFTLPRRLLLRYRAVPAEDFSAPGTFHYAELERVSRDFAEAGFSIELVEEMEIPVMEASSSAEVVAWTRAMGLGKLLMDLPEDVQAAWERDLSDELERLKKGARFQLGGVTRIVVARPTRS